MMNNKTMMNFAAMIKKKKGTAKLYICEKLHDIIIF